MATQLAGPVMPIKTVSSNFFKISLEPKLRQYFICEIAQQSTSNWLDFVSCHSYVDFYFASDDCSEI